MFERINFKKYNVRKEWFSIRNYSFNILDHDLRIEGLINIPKVLFDKSICEVRLNTQGIEEFKELYDFNTMSMISLDNAEWFISKATERTKNFAVIKTETAEIYNLLMTCMSNNAIEDNKNMIKKIFDDLHILYSKFVSYAYLGMYDKVLIQKFYFFLADFYSQMEISNIFNDLFQPSEYFFLNLDNTSLGEDKKIKIPYLTEYSPIYGNINTNYLDKVRKYELEFLPKIKKDSLELSKQYLKVVPLIFQLGQENIFIGKSIQPIFSLLFSELGIFLNRHKVVSTPESLLNMKYDIIFNLYLNS